MSIIRFDNVDVIFSKDPREALKLLDQGMSRNEILKKTGQIVGVEKASLDIEKGEICVLMGLLAEMVTRTFYEAQDKPTYMLRAKRNFERADG